MQFLSHFSAVPKKTTNLRYVKVVWRTRTSEESKDDVDGDEKDAKNGKDDNYRYEADVENDVVVERDHVMNVNTRNMFRITLVNTSSKISFNEHRFKPDYEKHSNILIT